jgi:hypothetical protein
MRFLPFKTLSFTLLIGFGLSYSPGAAAQYTTVYPDTLNKKRLYTTVGVGLGTYAAGLSFLSFVWYKDKERVPFNFYDDSKGYLQMDKAGHAYAAYWQTHLAYRALRRAGLSKKKALWYGGPVGLVFQTPIEIFDGLYEGWGFSTSDMLANALGPALFVAQEAFFDDQIVLMKFSYSPSVYPTYHSHLGETPLESFFLDYNAHTYWLSGNLKKMTGLEVLPPWLNVAFGYSANGMIYEFDNPEFYRGEPFPDLERYRQYLFSFDVDFTKIPTKHAWLRRVFRTLNMVKVPFSALEYNRVQGFQFRPLYF